MNKLDKFARENEAQLDRQKALLEEMNERLDRQYGDEPRESLSEIITRAQNDRDRKKDLLKDMNKRLDEQSRYEPEGASLIKTSGVIRNERKETFER
jgi:hypothetical protein